MIGLSRTALIAKAQIPKALREKLSLVLATSAVFALPVLAVDPQSDAVTVRIKRTTTAQPVPWANTSQVRVTVIIAADGLEYRTVGLVTGGIRTNRTGAEIGFYTMKVKPPYGFFGAQTGMPKRLGETVSAFTARAQVECLSGSINTEIEVSSTQSPAPQNPFHSSVAFDAATSAEEISGDGVLSLSHTSAGSDRAVFAGVTLSAGSPPTSSTVTYGGTGMTQKWSNTLQTFFSNAGYALAGQATSAQTVTSTLSGAADEHFLGVVSMTGADQTTPTGTPQVTSTASSVTSISVTVGSVGADDFLCDNFYVTDHVAPTIGADQTERNAQSESTTHFRGSTQLGSAGGVMSWTAPIGPFAMTLGAIAFKPVAAGGTAFPHHYYAQQRAA